jgi:predicted pyridoxine 5'-phosphate oxidase superfamily flavin-nucleotide-binding protein/uncharacterized protein (DUF433 family)
MGHCFAEMAFTPAVKRVQERMGSRTAYARLEAGETRNGVLGPREVGFIAARDSFYMASVSETGWPYLQHRGGPPGFLRVLDKSTIGFADFRGNRQYVSVGNLAGNDRVALILVDYPNRRRLKILGRARVVEVEEDPALAARLAPAGYPAQVERGILIRIEAFDWNCPQHIAPRFTALEVEAITAPLHTRIAELEARLAAPTSGAIEDKVAYSKVEMAPEVRMQASTDKPAELSGRRSQKETRGMAAKRHERIVSDSEIMRGKPTIKGTRITVELILQELGEGASVNDLLADHPNLAREDVLAALRFAADSMRLEDVEFARPDAA